MKYMRQVKKYIGMGVLVGVVSVVYGSLPVRAVSLGEQLGGRMLLQVEAHGEAWYVNPVDQQRYYMGRPADAFDLMRELGLGISNADLARIPTSDSSSAGDRGLVNRLRGRILLQVESKGEAWYVNPVDGKRYFLGRPADAFSLMRELGLGINNQNLATITIARDIPTQPASSVIDVSHTQPDTVVQTDVDLPGPLPAVVGTPLNTPLTQAGIFNETNKQRTENGLTAFKENKALNQAALKKVQDMADQQYFEHVSPQGKDVTDLAHEVGYAYIRVGENIAVGNTFTDESLLIAWMNSPGHRANILNSAFTEVGVAAVPGVYQGMDVWFAAQEFGRPQSDCPIIDDAIKTRIDEINAMLDELQTRITNQKSILTSYGTVDTTNQEEVDAYNADVEVYNTLIADYNERQAVLEDLAIRYNMQVEAYNTCAGL